MKKLTLLCTVLLCTSVVLAQTDKPVKKAGTVTDLKAGSQVLKVTHLADAAVASTRSGVVATEGRDGRQPGNECPANYLCGQNQSGTTWLWSDVGYTATGVPPECPGFSKGRISTEIFPPPGVPDLEDPIGVIMWHGLFLDNNSNGTAKDHLFRVQFYPDDGTGKPDAENPLFTYYVEPFREEIVGQVIFSGGTIPADEWEFWVILPETVSLPNGHFSIASAIDQAEAYHLLGPSTDGNMQVWRYWEDPYCLFSSAFDFHYCFMTNEGPCCFPDGSCEYMSREVCEGEGNYCRADLNCDWLINFDDINPFVLRLSNESAYNAQYPDCDPLNGDINKDGEVDFDDINPFVQELSQAPFPECPNEDKGGGGIWLGPGRTCEECCDCECPQGGIPEGEEECYDGYVDTYNGGCDAETFAALPIADGDTYCGTSGTFVTNDVKTADTDWYEITTTQNSVFTLNFQATFTGRVSVIAGSCDDPITWAYVIPDICAEETLVTECLPPGTWYFRVAPAENIPCGRKYLLELDVTPGCTICNIDCPPDSFIEPEECGEDVNGNCPDAMTEIPWDTWVCGTAWASNGNYDEDWYLLDLSENAAKLTITLNTEIPLCLWLMLQDDCGTGYVTAFIPCEEGIAVIPDECRYGPAYIMIRPETAPNELVTYGYPCGYRNEYYFRIDCDFEACDCHDELANSGFPPEGEPVCYDEYVDTFNGGCDAQVEAFMPLNYEYWVWLAQSGKYDVGGEEVDETDWWEVDTSDWGSEGDHYQYKLQFQGEKSVHIEFYDASGGCPGLLLEIYNIPMCQIRSITTQCRPRGKYWFRVNVNGPCGVYYIIMLEEIIWCEPCIIECPPNSEPEGEDCGENNNGGCPPGTGFRTLPIDEYVCGTAWAHDGERDEDWYEFDLADNAEFIVWTTTEVPVCAVPIVATDANGVELGQVNCGGPSQWGYWSSCLLACDANEGFHYTACHPAGHYWVFVAPALLGDDGFPDPIFYSYPCGTSNDYWMQITLENVGCTP